MTAALLIALILVGAGIVETWRLNRRRDASTNNGEEL